jgi:hypothetical protein
MYQQKLTDRKKEDLVDTIAKILKGERNLDFLLELNLKELEILLACLRDRVDQEKNFTSVST